MLSQHYCILEGLLNQGSGRRKTKSRNWGKSRTTEVSAGYEELHHTTAGTVGKTEPWNKRSLLKSKKLPKVHPQHYLLFFFPINTSLNGAVAGSVCNFSM